MEAWIQQAEREASALVNNTVSVAAKAKTLRKFGFRAALADSVATIAEFPSGILHETYATDATISHGVSTSTADVGQVIYVEGHYPDANGNFIFHRQTYVSQGRTPVPLAQPLIRSTRAANLSATPLQGDVAIYDNSLGAGGVDAGGSPNEPTAVKLMIRGTTGWQNSRKCATSLSWKDFWFPSQSWATALRASGGSLGVDCRIEYRTHTLGVFGGWLDLGVELSMRTTDAPKDEQNYGPLLIIPPNSDIRMVGVATAASANVAGTINGLLALVV